jgi:hypothetical protein
VRSACLERRRLIAWQWHLLYVLDVSREMVIAAVAGMFGLVPSFVDWILAERSQRSKRNRIQALHSEVEFFERLLNLEKAAPLPNLSVLPSIPFQRILDDYHSLQHEELEHESEIPMRLRLQRMFLLIRFTNRKARLSAIGFRVTGVVLMFLLFSVLVASEKSQSGRDIATTMAGLTGLFGVPMIALQRFALNREDAAARPANPRKDREPAVNDEMADPVIAEKVQKLERGLGAGKLGVAALLDAHPET